MTLACDGMECAGAVHSRLSDAAEGRPAIGEKRVIYHFFTEDPEGRRVESRLFL